MPVRPLCLLHQLLQAHESRAVHQQAFRGDEDCSTGIAVGPGLDSEHMVFPLTVSASISGSVVDEEGEAVRQAQIWLFHKGVSSGRSRITMRNSQVTDSSGSFHFSHLAPGTYFVAAQARPWYAETVVPQPDSGKRARR
jgi:Carboxypeptidase regulatory-like domain